MLYLIRTFSVFILFKVICLQDIIFKSLHLLEAIQLHLWILLGLQLSNVAEFFNSSPIPSRLYLYFNFAISLIDLCKGWRSLFIIFYRFFFVATFHLISGGGTMLPNSRTFIFCSLLGAACKIILRISFRATSIFSPWAEWLQIG